MRRRRSAESIRDEKFFAGFVCQIKVKALQLHTQALDARSTRRNRLVNKTHQRLVIRLHNDRLAVNILTKAHQTEVNRQEFFFNLEVSLLRIRQRR